MAQIDPKGNWLASPTVRLYEIVHPVHVLFSWIVWRSTAGELLWLERTTRDCDFPSPFTADFFVWLSDRAADGLPIDALAVFDALRAEHSPYLGLACRAIELPWAALDAAGDVASIVHAMRDANERLRNRQEQTTARPTAAARSA